MKDISINEWIWFGLGAIVFSIYGIYSKKVSISGALSGIAIAVILFIFLKWEGISYFLLFFLLGTGATKWKKDKKEKLGLAQENKGKRTHIHAICNAGAAITFSIMYYFNLLDLFSLTIIIASIFAAANSDTLSSELGNVVGSKYVNVLNLKKDEKGKDGVISPEGTLIGLLGSVIIALLHFLYHEELFAFLIISVSGFTANLLDSFLGATLQNKGLLTNHTVNLTITHAAGILALILY